MKGIRLGGLILGVCLVSEQDTHQNLGGMEWKTK